MPRWEKLLAAMVSDSRPRSYTYDEAATVLAALGFALASRGGSHRKWRLVVGEGGTRRTIVIGLLDRGRGNLPPEYVKDMVHILRENGLLPHGVGDAD